MWKTNYTPSDFENVHYPAADDVLANISGSSENTATTKPLSMQSSSNTQNSSSQGFVIDDLVATIDTGTILTPPTTLTIDELHQSRKKRKSKSTNFLREQNTGAFTSLPLAAAGGGVPSRKKKKRREKIKSKSSKALLKDCNETEGPPSSSLQPIKRNRSRIQDLRNLRLTHEQDITYTGRSQCKRSIRMRQDESTLSSSTSHDKWETFVAQEEDDLGIGAGKWDFFDEQTQVTDEARLRGRSEDSPLKNIEKVDSVIQPPGGTWTRVKPETMISISPPRGTSTVLEKSASQKLADAAIDRRVQRLLVRYLRSVGTNPVNAKEIAKTFRQQQAVRKSQGMFDDESAVSGLSGNQLADLYSTMKRGKAARDTETAPTPTFHQLPGTNRPTERMTRLAVTRSIEEPSDRRSRKVPVMHPPPLTQNNSDAPEGILIEDSTLGALRQQQQDIGFQQTVDEEQGSGSLSCQTHVVQARVVKESDDFSVVYADSSPLSTCQLLQEKGVRRIIAVACFLVLIATVGGISGAMLHTRNPSSHSTGQVTFDQIFPTTAPTAV